MGSPVGMLRIPYREARDGFWGQHTSTLNWCEEDYNITYYCAELINTLTNLTFVYLGTKGIRDVLAHGHSRVFVIAFLGYLSIGLGSFAFHATLRYSMQLADELPMIYTACIMTYSAFSYRKSLEAQIRVALSCFLIAGFVTVSYVSGKNPVWHQAAFGSLMTSIIFRGFYIIASVAEPALQKRRPAQAQVLMRETWRLAATGVFQFLLGFLIWGLDRIYCESLLTARHTILLPWAALLEGHAWWHILTGLGYHLIVWRMWTVCLLDGNEDKFMLEWTSFGLVARLVPRVQDLGPIRKPAKLNS